MKDIKFSLYFPKYHVRAGDPTHFVEKIWQAIAGDKKEAFRQGLERAGDFQRPFIESFASKEWTPKRTTIRAGHRWKKGDMFVPKIWTGLPYRSKPIAICEPLEVIQIEKFEITNSNLPCCWLNNDFIGYELESIAHEDGFENEEDFLAWFNVKKGQTFEGQRIRFA